MTEPARRPILLKVGGRELLPGPALARLSELVGELRASARSVILVHGGGEEVTDRAAALGLRTSRWRGQRVTSAPMLEVVLEVLGGRVNSRLVAALTTAGVPAVGLTGADGSLLTVRPAGVPPGRLGFVGEPRVVRPAALAALLTQGLTPVVAPIGIDDRGQLYNVNADTAAAALASALGAELWMLTDVPAVRDGRGRALPRLSPAEAERLIGSGVAREGMIPKLEAAIAAIRGGALSSWVGPLEALGPGGPRAGSGTWIPAAPSAPAALPLLAAPPRGGGGSRP